MPQALLKEAPAEGQWPRATELPAEGANEDLPAQFPGECHCTHLLGLSCDKALKASSAAVTFLDISL